MPETLYVRANSNMLDQRALPRSKTPVQGSQKLQKPLRQVSFQIKCRRRTVHLKAIEDNVAESKSGYCRLGS